MEVIRLIEKRELVRKKVAEYFFKNIRFTCPHLTEDFITENADHIINIGTSIYCTKRGIGPAGGSFVAAVVNNDLSGAFGRADDVNISVLKFYVVLIANL